MPWSEKQNRYFQAVAHGWKPRRKGQARPLSASKAKELLSHEDRKIQAKVKGQKRALESL